MKYDIVALYVCIDDFSKIYQECEQKKLIEEIKYKSLFKEVPCYDRFIQIMPIKITKGNVLMIEHWLQS